ncbi:MAG: Rieske 2Fe-2S domain-containing protein, partial [Myxococcota bacterium]
FCVEDLCSHRRVPLNQGHLEAHSLFCPLHGACFDVRTGEAQQLPAKQPIRVFPTLVEKGEVYVLF